MGTLSNKVALVTGAGQGIGQGVAYALAAAGAAVGILGRTPGKLAETVTEIGRRGGKAVAVECDVTKPAEIDEAVEQIRADLGGLNILVNNAQEFCFGTLNDIGLDSVDEGWKSGPLATLLFMRSAFPALRGDGVVINVSSSAAVDAAVAGIGIYGATKSAIGALSRAAGVEWAGEGIRVNTIMPVARTPAVQAVLDRNPGFEERMIDEIPLGRLGDPEADIGAAVVFLCSDQARYITGTTLTIDGGSTRLR
jgi:NAD(P)-dependent dehydrogenase (short-subunit alcohol dehydrogenase family)